MSETPDLGFSVSLFTAFPLPRDNQGQVFTRESNGVTCSYLCALGVPHTAVERRWLEILTTLARYNVDNPLVEFGAITESLRRYGMDSTGGKRGYVQPARKALEKLARLHISSTRTATVRGLTCHQGMDFSISKRHQILWARGRTDLVEAELFDNENYMEVTPEFMTFVKNAAPHIQKDFMQIRAPLTQDLYQWLVAKLYTLKEPWTMTWPAFYAQFGQGGRLSENQMKNMRKAIKSAMTDIKLNYYSRAKMEFTDEGLRLMPSPPLIEPDSKKAGFTLP